MATKPKADQDKEGEQQAQAPVVNEAAPTRVSSRIKGAYQLGGQWYTADGGLLTDPKDIQKAHRAMDAAAAEARRKALLGGE